MATTTIVLPVPVDEAFTVLEDPRSLAYFVVGSRSIRRFDPSWPDPHTMVHHSVGVGPLVIRDTTEVLELDAPGRLVLEARIRPLGMLRVEFHLTGHPEGSELTVVEYPTQGILALPGVDRMVDAVVGLRNLETVRRLKKLMAMRADDRRTVSSGA